MKTVRLQVIEYIREHRVATAADLSRVLHLTPADVRHHLTQLEKQGCLLSLGHRRAQHRGRPAKLYALSESMSRGNLDLLSHFLLKQASLQCLSADFQDSLKFIAEQFAADFEQGGENLSRRIYLAINYLKKLNYDASWEAHSLSPRLILGHCPFFAIISQHPEMCLVDAYLFEKLLGKPVQQIDKLSIATRELPYCVFLIQDSYTMHQISPTQ